MNLVRFAFLFQVYTWHDRTGYNTKLFASVFACEFIYIYHECACFECGGQKMVSDPVTLELEVVCKPSCYIGSGNPARVLCKSSERG